MKAGRHTIEISNEEKVLFPKHGLTKMDVITYYLDVADYILPHLKNRPLMMQRFPDGIDEDGFYQKEASDYFPDWIETTEVKKEGGTVRHVLCNNKDTLVYLANQGTISFHSWLSKADVVNKPDKFIIDLDPPSTDFDIVRKGALALRKYFDDRNITSFLMTTGSKGLHIVIPLDSKSDFEASRDAGKLLAEEASKQHPDIFTTEARKNKRNGRLYFDIQRNAYAQTGITAYSLRPYENAPVATPHDWSELEDDDINARSFHIKNIKKRLAHTDDPWMGIRRHAMSVDGLKKKFQTKNP